MRRFKEGKTIRVEPFGAGAFPIVRDLVVDRSAFDHVIEAGGYIPVRTSSVPKANAIPIAKAAADLARDAAAGIRCGVAWRLVQTPKRCCLWRPTPKHARAASERNRRRLIGWKPLFNLMRSGK